MRQVVRLLPVLCAAAVILASCGSPTAPKPAAVHRTVTFAVTDSLGAPATLCTVAITSTDSVGFMDLALMATDSSGHVRLVMREGAASVEAIVPGLSGMVAGTSFVVPGTSRAATDSILVRLRLGTGSSAHGTITLQGRTVHDQTFISANGLFTFSQTDSSGAFEIGQLPPGRWMLDYTHIGFAPASRVVIVTQPGSVVAVPAVQLQLLTREP